MPARGVLEERGGPFHYCLLQCHCLLQCQQVLAIPTKRYAKCTVEFLNEQETGALVAAPDLSTWIGRRDRALLLLAVQTGLRSQELRALCARDVELNASAFVRCLGKGRKQRNTPLRTDVVVILRDWLAEQSPYMVRPAMQEPLDCSAEGNVAAIYPAS
ncbi:tyrosine-type recombinase/integrase [Lamprobacter modestohalophilus]|uniref:tyrosine-type recombinase/integrase n=1 Tax=Lamprobacter modestohalophilus TaxID=1064514 RepID=UPI00190374AD